MDKHTNTTDLGHMAEEAHALIDATADVAGEKIAEARNRLADALKHGKEMYGRVREKTVEGAKAADVAVREHPYQAIGIAVVAGALVGYLIGRRCSRSDD